MDDFVAFVAITIGAFWLFFSWRLFCGVRALQTLPAIDQRAHNALRGKRVSIIVAARNEAERIGETIQRLAGQQSIDFELIVVNDRSSDSTEQIVHQASVDNPLVQHVNIETLPDGWLGKCHACWQAAKVSTGEWLLFTDGDVHMSDQLVARAVAKAEAEQADHLALLPQIVANDFWTRVALLGQMQLFTLYTSPNKINTDRSKRWVGVGAFNLFERDTYFSIGGHEAVRMEVVEDMKLGYLVHKHRFRQRAYSGEGDLEVDWAQSIPGILAATEKNWFAAVDYKVLSGIAIFSFLPAMVLLTLCLLCGGGFWGWIPFLALATVVIPGTHAARRFGWQQSIALFAPAGWFVFSAAGVNSMWKTLRNGGVSWRDHFYPLDELREGVVR